MSIAYPTAIPLDDISNVIMTLTGGIPDKALIAKSLWSTTGYVLYISIGEPASHAEVFAAAQGSTSPQGLRGHVLGGYSTADVNHITNDQAAALLNALTVIETAKEPHESFRAAGLLDAILGADFVKKQIANLLLPFLLNKLKEWIAGGGLDAFLKINEVRAAVSCCKH